MKTLALLCLALTGCDTLAQPFEPSRPCYTVREYDWEGVLLDEYEASGYIEDFPPVGVVRVTLPGCERRG